LTIVALAGALWTCTLWGFAPFSDNSVVTYTVAPTSISALNNLEQLISPNAVVSAWYPLVSHIDERSQIYVWPTPFYAENYGVGNVTGQRLPAANQVQYLLLPIHLNSGTDPKVFQDIRSDYRLVQSQGGFGLYEKKSTT
jgi:hypothetical protein